jgi:hypothetical protein
MEHSNTGATLCLGRQRRCADVAYPQERAEAYASQGAAERLQNLNNQVASSRTSAASPGASTAAGGSASRSGDRRQTILVPTVGRKMSRVGRIRYANGTSQVPSRFIDMGVC